MSALETRIAIFGAILCLLGLMMLAYGMNTMDYTNTVSSSFTIILGVFIGMIGLVILMIDFLPGRAPC
jgi:protein-S-isoprenylcysteine O-methyltransferase Ste14